MARRALAAGEEEAEAREQQPRVAAAELPVSVRVPEEEQEAVEEEQPVQVYIVPAAPVQPWVPGQVPLVSEVRVYKQAEREAAEAAPVSVPFYK